MPDHDICAACLRRFTARSRPRWAFTKEGRPVGKVHATCVLARGHHYVQSSLGPLMAQFDVWDLWLHPTPPRESDAWQARFLIDPADASLPETLNAAQEDRLYFWTERVRNPLSRSRVPGIRAAYADMIRRFHAWRAGLDPAPDGCALATGTGAV